MNCAQCGVANADHAKFCKACGEKLVAPMPAASDGAAFCTECGARNAESAKFCCQCGHAMHGSAAHPKSQAAASGTSKVLIILSAAFLLAAAGAAAWLVMKKKPAEPGIVPAAAMEQSRADKKRSLEPGEEIIEDKARTDTVSNEPANAAPPLAQTEAKPKPESERPRRERADSRQSTGAQPQQQAAQSTEPRPRQQVAPAHTAAAAGVKQECSSSSNSFTRDMCEAKECLRSQYRNSAYCAEVRQRQNQDAQRGMPGV